MAQAPRYNAQGEKVGMAELADAIFGVTPKNALVHQVYTSERANLREPWADTKNKGEVRGGGRKPWQQKGTGRARHGSIRSPIWRGGGVTFGPLSIRNYTQKVNKKMSQGAMRMCLSDKVKHGMLAVVEAFDTKGKTKAFAALREKLPGNGTSAIVLVGEKDTDTERAVRNVQKVDMCRAQDVNVMDLLHHQTVFVTDVGVKELEKRLS